jgi:DNA-3-methyladenine glycosylase II
MQRQCVIAVPPPFRFDLTASFFARFATEIVDRFGGGIYRRALWVDGEAVAVRVRPSGAGRLGVTVEGRRVSDEAAGAARRTVARMFGIGQDLAGFYSVARQDPVLVRALPHLRGMRIAGYASLFEALVIAILSQQVTIQFANVLKGRLVEAFGTPVRAGGTKLWAFPRPEDLAEARVADLRAMQLSTRKGEYVVGLARTFAEGAWEEAALAALEDEAFVQTVAGLRGLGRWSAEWALIRGLGRPDLLPADDVGVRRALSEAYFGGRRVTAQMVDRFGRRWRPHRSLAISYLFAARRLGLLQRRDLGGGS